MGDRCKVHGCLSSRRTLGYCGKHYQQFRRGTLGLSYDKYSSPFRMRTLHTVHVKLRELWGPAKEFPCVRCAIPAAHWAYDGTDPTQLLGGKWGSATLRWYSLYPEFYMPMCVRCHARMDKGNAAAELREYRKWKYETGMRLDQITTGRGGVPNG